MRKPAILAAMAATAIIAAFSTANAGLPGTPMGLQSAIQHINYPAYKI
jgi:hypothetical protein